MRDAGKPVIVSMGDVAASGGYYISCCADVIVALPATVTGSIGVLSGKFVTAGLMERMGLTTGTVAQGDQALMYSSRRRFDEAERANLAATVDAIYRDFVGKVASGRGRSFDRDRAARPRPGLDRAGRSGARSGRSNRWTAGGDRDRPHPGRTARRRSGGAGAAPALVCPIGAAPQQRGPAGARHRDVARAGRSRRGAGRVWTRWPSGCRHCACARGVVPGPRGRAPGGRCGARPAAG